ncbi:MAG: 3-dehydroquinate synthase, partial [Candidatus Izimaplasma sp.]|nr:3-dehydroquinate synthase [Candidatus Izimaplasma bacterium]
MIKINVPFKDYSYICMIKNNLLLSIEDYIDTTKETIIITDDGIPQEHLDKIIPKFTNLLTLTIPQGEHSKSMETASLLIEKMLEKNISRAAQLIAFGGGVVGDLAGFVASIYKRGIDYYQIPTTLLAQIDSSVGGKVAVNSNTVKNAIGAFKQPK